MARANLSDRQLRKFSARQLLEAYDYRSKARGKHIERAALLADELAVIQAEIDRRNSLTEEQGNGESRIEPMHADSAGTGRESLD